MPYIPSHRQKCVPPFVSSRHSLDERTKQVRGLRLEPPTHATFSLADIIWTVETLRILTHQMLTRRKVGVRALVDAWDQTGDRTLSLRDFVANVKSLVKDNELWETDVKDVASQAFNDILKQSKSTAGTVATIELERWLHQPVVGKVMEKSRCPMRRMSTMTESKAKANLKEMVNRRFRKQISARAIIDATATAVAREQMSRLEELRSIRRWKESRDTQVGGQRFDLPPLQRWETPKALELPALKIGNNGFGRPSTDLSPRFSPRDPSTLSVSSSRPNTSPRTIGPRHRMKDRWKPLPPRLTAGPYFV